MKPFVAEYSDIAGNCLKVNQTDFGLQVTVNNCIVTEYSELWHLSETHGVRLSFDGKNFSCQTVELIPSVDATMRDIERRRAWSREHMVTVFPSELKLLFDEIKRLRTVEPRNSLEES